jgi:hypothetical protein
LSGARATQIILAKAGIHGLHGARATQIILAKAGSNVFSEHYENA